MALARSEECSSLWCRVPSSSPVAASESPTERSRAQSRQYEPSSLRVPKILTTSFPEPPPGSRTGPDDRRRFRLRRGKGWSTCSSDTRPGASVGGAHLPLRKPRIVGDHDIPTLGKRATANVLAAGCRSHDAALGRQTTMRAPRTAPPDVSSVAVPISLAAAAPRAAASQRQNTNGGEPDTCHRGTLGSSRSSCSSCSTDFVTSREESTVLRPAAKGAGLTV